MNFKTKLFFAVILFICTSCSSVQVDIKKTEQELLSQPTFSDYRAYAFWGFLQTRQVNLVRACPTSTPLRVRSYASAEDVLGMIFTLGLYTSRTVEVWCAL